LKNSQATTKNKTIYLLNKSCTIAQPDKENLKILSKLFDKIYNSTQAAIDLDLVPRNVGKKRIRLPNQHIYLPLENKISNQPNEEQQWPGATGIAADVLKAMPA
jgi:hypothetical protein